MQIPKEITKVVNVLKKSKNIKAIGIYGSFALGFSDEYSDFDLIVFCSKIPSIKWREKVLKPKTKKWYPFYSMGGFIDVFNIGSFKSSSVWYKEIKEIKDFIKLFKKRSQLNDELVTFIYYSKSLYDPKKLMSGWKKMMKKYPDWLRSRTISNLVGVFRFLRTDAIERELKRKNINYLNERLAYCKETLDKSLFALNKMYYCPKWTFKFYSKFKLIPNDYVKKINEFNNLKGLSFKRKVKIIDHLVTEVNKIMKKEIPDLKIPTEF